MALYLRFVALSNGIIHDQRRARLFFQGSDKRAIVALLGPFLGVIVGLKIRKRMKQSKGGSGRSKSSGRWLQEHFQDPYVKASQKDGYRSRASYKLLEINNKDKLIKPGMRIVDLGAAPGGWSQVAAACVGGKGLVIASDILIMDALADVTFIQGDFTEDAVFDKLKLAVGELGADVVISDMAPNMSGIKGADQPKAMYLVELALDMCHQVLKPGGAFICKAFHGEGFDEWVKTCRQGFDKVVTRKPDASRARSSEVYLVGKGFKGS